MTCKENCLYYEACIGWVEPEELMEHNKPESCKTFKNKADFVEVVRCKDCKHRSTDDFRSFYCRKDDVACKDDDFCSDGERE